MRSLLTILVAAVVLSPLTAFSEVEGPVWGIWPGPDTVRINGEVWVPSDSTLVIEPGVVVLFEGHYKFIVQENATLRAVGEESDSIVFTTEDPATGWHGIRFLSASDSSQLSYCLIEYGKATRSDEDAQGGAIYCSNSSPTISDNSISNNSAVDDGGGIYCENSSPTISDNTISNNSATYYGGGIYCYYNSSPTISNNTISDNSTSDYGGGISCFHNSDPTISGNTISNNSANNSYGGGIYCEYNSDPTISGNTISNNSANTKGGGIYCSNNSNPTIGNNAISNNSANSYGGGIYCISSSPNINNNSISDNNTTASGGGIFCDNSSPTIEYNTIDSNQAVSAGGGIYCASNSNPTIIGNTINSNSASSGGGIYCEDSPNAVIDGNAISDNSATGRGGGIACSNCDTLQMSGNTISGNSAVWGGAIHCSNTDANITYNSIFDDSVAYDAGGVWCGEGSNCTISYNRITDNSAGRHGGGIVCEVNCTTQVTNNTISGNKAAINFSGAYGGGLFVYNYAHATVLNTILWADSACNHPDPDEIFVGPNSSVAVTYSDVQDTLWPGDGNISCDPQFCYPDTGNYYLHENSCCVGAGQGGVDIGAFGVGCPPEPEITLTIIPGDTVVAHTDTLCYHVICENRTPDYQSLSFKVNVRLPNGNMYGPIFGPARFGMFGYGISRGDMCHFVPPQAPIGDYWLFAEVYNLELSARDSMAFAVTGDGQLAGLESALGEWQTVVARLGDQDLLGGGIEIGIPTQFALQGNYPNPFNASTTINYQLPTTSDVKLEVYNLLGRNVATMVDERQQAGYRSVIWDASEVSSGLYFYKLTAGEFTETRRMMLVK